MARHFTLQEAEALLPELERSIRTAIALKAEYAEADNQLGKVARRIAMSGGVLVNRQGNSIRLYGKAGVKVMIKPKRLPFFKSGKELKERVDN